MPSDLEGRFRTHACYIEALAMLAGLRGTRSEASALSWLADATRSSAAMTDTAQGRVAYDNVQKRLYNAWGTELLLVMAGLWDVEDEFVRLANSWGVVQLYYSSYHQTQALIVARGGDRPTSHQRTQNLFVDLWVTRALDLPPWTLGVDHGGFRNVRAGKVVDPTIHAWSSCDADTCWSIGGKSMHTTRKDALEEAHGRKRVEKQRAKRRDWEGEERTRLAAGRRPRRPPRIPLPRLSGSEKIQADRRLRAYSVLDYFYRLRIRANYDDSAVFVDGPTSQADSELLRRRIRYLCAATSLVTELRILHVVGSARLHTWADEFVRSNVPRGREPGIAGRRHLLHP